MIETENTQPEPSRAIRCASGDCGYSVIGYTRSTISVVTPYWCETCAENEWQKPQPVVSLEDMVQAEIRYRFGLPLPDSPT